MHSYYKQFNFSISGLQSGGQVCSCQETGGLSTGFSWAPIERSGSGERDTELHFHEMGCLKAEACIGKWAFVFAVKLMENA